jgi:hypothetical protein
VTAAVRVIALKAVWEMLMKCAIGYNRRATKHYWRVTYEGKTYATLPLGEHGRRTNPQIEAGHIRKMLRHLGIEECARSQLPDCF